MHPAVARSALIVAQASQHLGCSRLVGGGGQRVKEIVELSGRGGDVTGGSKLIQRPAVRQRRENGHWPTSVGDLDRLSRLHEPQQFARSLPEFSHAD